MAMKGRIKKWNADKGFGFIQPLEGGTCQRHLSQLFKN